MNVVAENYVSTKNTEQVRFGNQKLVVALEYKYNPVTSQVFCSLKSKGFNSKLPGTNYCTSGHFHSIQQDHTGNDLNR